MLDVLVAAPHPDDAELAMAGAVMSMIEGGLRVGILDLTNGEPTPYGDVATRARETQAATELLGVQWRQNLGLPNRSLVADLTARKAVANVIRTVQPKWLFAPYWVDAHPDHVAATQLVEDARFWAKLVKSDLSGMPCHPQRIYHYFSIHLRLAVQPDFVLDISRYWPRKLATLECYHSQFVKGRDTEQPPLLTRWRDQAAYWGQLIGVEYGEPFACREPVGITSLATLV